MSPGEGVRNNYRKQGVEEFRAALVKAIELNDYGLYEMIELGDYDRPVMTTSSIAKFVKEFEI